MAPLTSEILIEWEHGRYYTDDILSEAYTTFLLSFLEASEEDRIDLRIPEFLQAGYDAYLRVQDGADIRAANVIYRMAHAMTGSSAPPRLATLPGTPSRPAPPQPARSPPRVAGICSWLCVLFRTVFPFFRSGALAVGREVLRAGSHVLADVVEEAAGNLTRFLRHKLEGQPSSSFTTISETG